MPRSPVVHGAGRINMKGRRYKLLSCKCCQCIDFRDGELKKEHNKYMKEEIGQVAQLDRASRYEREG